LQTQSRGLRGVSDTFLRRKKWLIEPTFRSQVLPAMIHLVLLSNPETNWFDRAFGGVAADE